MGAEAPSAGPGALIGQAVNVAVTGVLNAVERGSGPSPGPLPPVRRAGVSGRFGLESFDLQKNQIGSVPWTISGAPTSVYVIYGAVAVQAPIGAIVTAKVGASVTPGKVESASVPTSVPFTAFGVGGSTISIEVGYTNLPSEDEVVRPVTVGFAALGPIR